MGLKVTSCQYERKIYVYIYIYTYISYCTSSEMIHRGDAQMNSYRYDRTTSAEDTPEMHRSLLVCTGLM